MTRTDRRRVGAAAAVLVAAAACGSDPSPSPAAPATTTAALPKDGEAVDLDPSGFTVDITNRWWPMEVGDRWAYEESDGEGDVQQIEVTVLDRTKVVAAGVEARVVHDVATTVDGEVVEDTLDYYAQDADGNVWYLGEKTAEYENGEVATTEGSWEAGVDGAQAGILLPAHPEPGQQYRQEYYEGKAEDRARVLSLDERVSVPYGDFDTALMTEDTTPLEPGVVERKYYVRDVGPVLAVSLSDGAREELVSFETRAP
jgi:hypothetical protein